MKRKEISVAHAFIEHLKGDHEKQRKLGKELREETDPEKRKALWEDFYEELFPHLLGEEASVFNFMEESGGSAREEALKAMQEHHVAKILMDEINDLDFDDEEFGPKVYMLDRHNREHIREEERTYFPILEKIASDDEMDFLFDEKYEKTEEEIKEDMG